MRKIVTAHVYPPIPVRQYDWCAHYDGEEEAGNYGWGATEEEAIADFIENYAEGHDERLGECAKPLMKPTCGPDDGSDEGPWIEVPAHLIDGPRSLNVSPDTARADVEGEQVARVA